MPDRQASFWRLLVTALVGAGTLHCGSSLVTPLPSAAPGVVFSFPFNGQVDVPIGARVVVTFSDPVDASALATACTSTVGAFCLLGPTGPVAARAEVTGDGRSVQFAAGTLEPATTYELMVRSPIAPTAANLPTAGPLLRFTTRNMRSRAAAPQVLAINGEPMAGFSNAPTRTLVESTTLRLVFSEPLDPRSVTLAPGAIELIESATNTKIAATVYANGIHVAIDPSDDLVAGKVYQLRLGSGLVDLGGQPLTPVTLTITPRNSRGSIAPIPQVLRVRQPGDSGNVIERTGAPPNRLTIESPLLGPTTKTVLASAVLAELGDPKALDGPIAFTIRRGQRLAISELDVKLGGVIPAGLTTGGLEIEFLTDGGGLIYRNPFQPAEQRPENERAPLYVDLTFDLAVFAKDATGNAVLAQTILGVQAIGTVTATDGSLVIEIVGSLDFALLGVSTAPTNMVLSLVTDATAPRPADAVAPVLLATYPVDGATDQPANDAIELVFSEPIDVTRLRKGGLEVRSAAGIVVPSVIDSRGAAIVIRPLAPLASGTSYAVMFTDVVDVAGNALAAAMPIRFTTEFIESTSVPPTITAIVPGAPCALTNVLANAAGRCAGGASNDAQYRPFELASNQLIEAEFSSPIRSASIRVGIRCGEGSVRVELLDAAGTCTAAVAGTLLARDRGFTFVPDQPWTVGTRYRLTLISGSNPRCDAGELCGSNNEAASFDPLAGAGNADGGGPNLAIEFVGSPATKGTAMVTNTAPTTDLNGSGRVNTSELRRDENRAALRITNTTGAVSSARFTTTDCLPGTPEVEACMYLLGSVPVVLQEVKSNCSLPGGATAASCIPVAIAAGAIYATAVTMDARVGINIGADTETSILRIREPAAGPLLGYIVDKGGTPTFVVALDLYMDAPDMSLPLSSHDLRSKPVSVILEGPVRFLPDGRIVIELTNLADAEVVVNIDAPLGLRGAVVISIPARELKLRIVSQTLQRIRP